MSLLEHEGPVAASALPGRLDPRSRVLAVFGFALLVVLSAGAAAVGLALGMALAAALLVALPLAPTLRRLAALEGFMILTLGLLPLTVPGEALTTLGGVEISRAGCAQALMLLGKANAVTLMTLALVGTLDAATLGHALARLGAPVKLVWLYLFTIRYLDLLHREYQRLRTAMRARGFRMHSGRHCWTSLGLLFGMLMVRSVERAERILDAMRCRGFDGRLPAPAEEFGFSAPDRLFGLAAGGGAALLAAAGAL